MTTSSPAERSEYLKDPYHDVHHDPYFLKRKYKEPAVCGKCGVAFHKGLFAWPAQPIAGAESMTCPACLRIADKVEGGIVALSGDFLGQHQEEILNLIRHVEALEKGQRPLERIMSIEPSEGVITIKTTYEHLARRIGESVHRAYKGELRFAYADAEKFIRVHWSR